MSKISKFLLVTFILVNAPQVCFAPPPDAERPPEHICPITHAPMKDPVVAADGQSYEREAISKWFETSRKSPMTNTALENTNLIENLSLKKMIQDWKPGRHPNPSVLDSRPVSEITQRVRAEFEKNQPLLHSARGKDIVAFLGNTGAGKSTLVNVLAGKKLVVTPDEGDYVLDDPTDVTAMAIGTGGQSETLYPKFIDITTPATDIDDLQCFDCPPLRFFDFPGFNDTDGSERNLVNAAFMRQILLEAASVRLVFVAGEDQFTADRGTSIKQMFNSIKQLFVVAEQERDLVDEGVFVATKVLSHEHADLVSSLLKKTDSRDKEELHAQLQSWKRQGKLCRMLHPIRKEDLTSVREKILGLIKTTQPTKIRGINVSALYPPETVGPLERMFGNVMQETLDRRLGRSLITLSEYDKDLVYYTDQDFWESFDTTVCMEDKAMNFLREFCINPYNKAKGSLARENTRKLQEHIQGLNDRKQRRIKDIVERTERRAQEVLSSLVPRQDDDQNNGYFVFGHPKFYEQVCGEECISTLATDPLEQKVVCESYARFISRHSQEQMMAWQKRLLPYAARGYEDVYRRFVMGRLIYKPDPYSDNGRIELPIRDLANPLEGTFDLSRCGDTGKHLSISTGYRKSKKAENANKMEIWLAPRFLIEKELATTAIHFQPIMESWSAAAAPVGLFWTMGAWHQMKWYDYLTTNSFESLSDKNLYENASGVVSAIPLVTHVNTPQQKPWKLTEHTGAEMLRLFMVSFVKENPSPAAVVAIARPVLSEIVIPEIARGHEDVYRRFVMGRLIYKPDPYSDNGRIELPIRDLANPLEGTFDLSRCGDSGQHLSISTGYRKSKKAENAKKVEVWLAPRFLIERNLATTAAHFRGIMSSWNAAVAPAGVFWTWGDWDDMNWFDYLTTNSFDQLSDNKLYEKCAHHGDRPCFTSWGACGDYRHRSCSPRYERLQTNESPCFIFELK